MTLLRKTVRTTKLLQERSCGKFITSFVFSHYSVEISWFFFFVIFPKFFCTVIVIWCLRLNHSVTTNEHDIIKVSNDPVSKSRILAHTCKKQKKKCLYKIVIGNLIIFQLCKYTRFDKFL